MSEKERRIYSLIQKLEGTLYLKSGSDFKEVGKTWSERRGFDSKKGRPDFILWVMLSLDILRTRTRSIFPILIEEEGDGMSAATQDYTQFLNEEGLSVCMIVVGGETRETKQRTVRSPVKVELSQIPFSFVFPE